LRQSVYGRLAGYEDVNDAERLSRDPAMRTIVDRKGFDRRAASIRQMGRLETEWLATEENLAVLSDLSGIWIDRVHDRKKPKIILLDMDSSESPTHGDQEGSAYNGYFGGTCYHPLFCFNQFGDLERCLLRPGNVHSAEDWRIVLELVVEHWSLTTLREKLIKIGAKVVSHGRYVTFQLAEVAVPRELFRKILSLIDDLRPRPAPA
jgi:hypothetical protein